MTPRIFKTAATIVAAAMALALGLVAQPITPTPAAAEDSVDVYTTPGYHTVNGRKWHTTCEPYSSVIDRCRAEIWATTVTWDAAAGRYVQQSGYTFNNLTYLPGPEKTWRGNPLAATGIWTAADGRQWRTECNTATTGSNGCRTYTMTTYYGVVSENPRTYGQFRDWVFNNIVHIIPTPTAPPPVPEPGVCNDAPIPSGYEITKVNGKWLPHAVKTPYTPNTLYNPTSISNYIRNILSNTTLKGKSPEQWRCLLTVGTDALLAGSYTQQHHGKTVLWFPYQFKFSANPGSQIPDLQPGWISGLAQGAALGVFVELYNATNSSQWLSYGSQVFESFEVPLAEKGFVNREHGFLWFEEYPTVPATTVLNGHLEAVIGLDLWARASAVADSEQARARELFFEALEGLELELPKEEVAVQGGILSSYDLVRGYEAAPLRIVPTSSSFQLNSSRINGVPVTIPRASVTAPADNILTNLNSNVYLDLTGRMAGRWTNITPKAQSTVTHSGGTIAFTTDAGRWQGVQQLVNMTTNPANAALAGKDLTLTVDVRNTLMTTGAGLSGRIAVYQVCTSGTSLLFETQKVRGRQWDTYTMTFTAPPAGCDVLVQLLSSSYGLTGTRLEYRNISLRQADALGPNWDPNENPAAGRAAFYDLRVYEHPTYSLALAGSGSGRLQAHVDGQWQNVSTFTLSSTAQEIEIPQLLTGRNLHYGYHSVHVSELVSLWNRARQAGWSDADAEFLRATAERWELMAPDQHGKVPAKPTAADSRARTTGGDTVSDSGDDSAYDSRNLPLFDPFELLLEE